MRHDPVAAAVLARAVTDTPFVSFYGATKTIVQSSSGSGEFVGERTLRLNGILKPVLLCHCVVFSHGTISRRKYSVQGTPITSLSKKGNFDSTCLRLPVSFET